MSSRVEETITCQKCGKDSPFIVWRSINTMLNPELKAAVRDTSVFQFTCPHCGHSVRVDYGFLYHQMEDRIMIHYVQTDEGAKEIQDYLSGDSGMGRPFDPAALGGDKYLIRIVRSMNQMQEKLAIFDAGLDDRIVETAKVFVWSDYLKKHPESSDIETLMWTDDEKSNHIVILENGKTVASAPLSDDFYNAVKKLAAPKLVDIRDDHDLIIDRDWALQFFDVNTLF